MGVLPIQPVLPINPIHAQDTNSIRLSVDGVLFFIDNEYFGRRIEGYTLPGFRLEPKVDWVVGDRLTLQGGASWLHYWGAPSYPATAGYDVLPAYSDTSRPMHLVPWLQAKLKLAKWLELTLGSLDRTDHHLPEPLFNRERLCAADPEAGLMMEAWCSRGRAEVWADWREFIWDRSPRQERFTMGASGEWRPVDGQWIVGVPMHFIAQHVGGQILAQTTSIQNNFNAAAGLWLARRWDRWTIAARGYAMWYHQHGNKAVPFGQGWGLYPELMLRYRNRLQLSASYWQGENFVPLMGSWLYSSLSSVDGTTVLDPAQMLSLHASYVWQQPRNMFSLRAEAAAHYDIGERQTQFSVGCALSFYPSIRLR